MSGHPNRARLALPALLLVALAGGCSESGGDVFDPEVPPDFRATAITLDAAGKPADVFAPGEPVTLRLTVVNATDVYQTMTFSSAQLYDFVVLDGKDAEVWRWSFDKVFGPANDRLDFRPRQSVQFEEVWFQFAQDGSVAAAGDYTVKGTMTAETPDMPSGTHAFTIR